mgnify:CR=1 FL=1|jgi:hypothetical protein
MDKIIANLNRITVVQRDDGKYGIVDHVNEKTCYKFSTLYGAMQLAELMSADHDELDAYGD